MLQAVPMGFFVYMCSVGWPSHASTPAYPVSFEEHIGAGMRPEGGTGVGRSAAKRDARQYGFIGVVNAGVESCLAGWVLPQSVVADPGWQPLKSHRSDTSWRLPGLARPELPAVPLK